MRPGRAWTLYLLAVFVGGPLWAPWAYTAGQFAGEVPLFSALANAPFHRYLTRCMMVVAIVGLWPLFKALGLSSWQKLGFAPLKSNAHHLFRGFGLGFASLAIIMVISLASHGRAWRGDRDTVDVLGHLVNAGLAAIVVSPLEEVLFRGGLFGALRKEHGWKLALVVSSLVYAAVHFLDRARWTEPVTWSSGITLLGQMFAGAGWSAALMPRFLTLCVAGVVLGIAYHWTGNLWCSVGLHAGWIFWLKSYGFVTREVDGAAVWLWGTGRLIDGWLAVFVMLGALAVVLGWFTRRSQRLGNGCNTGQSGTHIV
ncbi:MAG: type II CAAX endopeptidase family protein [Verrucomicrobiota bacterium]|nr:type II CAAX endopeptidase family protein [Verrucomicrobiota bacterium]